MARKKRTSSVLTKAESRIAGLKAIDLTMDFGNDRNIPQLNQMIDQVRARLNTYNDALALIDSTKNELSDLEKQLNTLTDQMLLGVALQYGRDSHQYELAGGVRTSDRVRKSMRTRIKGTTEGQPTEPVLA
ncbi:MAG: hypothetical protein KME13_26960 [Myxacorys californica WJT36-NPBG1]|nr:hypothetical protein [Myxacorys californica WJT36-NPBG1]